MYKVQFLIFTIATSMLSMYRFYILNKRKMPATKAFSLIMSIAVGEITAFFCFILFNDKGEIATYSLTFCFSFISIPLVLSLLYKLIPNKSNQKS